MDINKIKAKINADLNNFVKNKKDELKADVTQKRLALINEPRQWAEGFKRTKRRNKTIVEGSFRDIVDLGNLERSFVCEWRGDDLYSSIDVPYDKYVVFGHYNRDGSFTPGRDIFKKL